MRVLLSALQTIVVATVANLALRLLALAVFAIQPEFPPLASPGPTIFFTVVGVSAALGVAVLLGPMSSPRVRLFRTVVLVALAVSLLPDLWLLTEGASEAFPGVTGPAVFTLMVQHVVAAFVVLWMVTMKRQSSMLR